MEGFYIQRVIGSIVFELLMLLLIFFNHDAYKLQIFSVPLVILTLVILFVKVRKMNEDENEDYNASDHFGRFSVGNNYFFWNNVFVLSAVKRSDIVWAYERVVKTTSGKKQYELVLADKAGHKMAASFVKEKHLHKLMEEFLARDDFVLGYIPEYDKEYKRNPIAFHAAHSRKNFFS